MIHFLWLIPLGFAVGTYGTLIGAGGGFVLMPILLLVYPNESHTVLASMSLAVVFFNAASGTIAYGRMKRVDYKSGVLFSVATIPGAVIGAMATSWMPRHTFQMALGILLICGCAFLIWHPGPETHGKVHHPKHFIRRRLVDAEGNVHEFAYNPYLGVALSFVVGFVSSLLGIGGGIVHVPALVHLMDFPVHFATATSHFVLAGMSFTGTVVHLASGVFGVGARRTLCLAVGALVGAQLGARLSARIHGVWIIRGLAIALGLVGIRVLMTA